MTDLYQGQKELDEKNLEKAIRTHDLPTAAVCLRRLRYKIPPAIVKIITDHLIDPVTAEKHKYKEGPKTRKEPLFVRKFSVALHYKTLCKDREQAQKLLQCDAKPSAKEIKRLVCDMYGIGTRKLETWLAEYNKK